MSSAHHSSREVAKSGAIRPLHDYLLVSRESSESVTKGGIHLPDVAQEKPQKGTVIAAGPGAWNKEGTARIPMSVKQGQKVLFTRWGGNEVKELGDDVLLIREGDVLALIEP